MCANVPDTGVDIPNVDQLGVVVEDLDAGIDRWSRVLGLEDWTTDRLEPSTISGTYRGEEETYGFRFGFAHAGEMMIEIIEPTDGRTIYRDYLNEHGPGLHHVACFSWSPEETYEVIKSFKSAGIDIVQTGQYEGTEFWYFDTADELYGLLFEMAVRDETTGPSSR